MFNRKISYKLSTVSISVAKKERKQVVRIEEIGLFSVLPYISPDGCQFKKLLAHADTRAEIITYVRSCTKPSIKTIKTKTDIFIARKYLTKQLILKKLREKVLFGHQALINK